MAFALTVATLILAIYAGIQAKAAKASADAIINSERAWVMIDIEWHMKGFSESIVNDVIKTGVSLILVCRNQGKSPCWITEKNLKFEIRELPLPLVPNLNGEGMEVDKVPQSLIVGEEKRIPIAPECVGNVREDGKTIVIYGVICYRDIFKNTRETTFGYQIKTGGHRELERLVGLPEYNKNT